MHWQFHSLEENEDGIPEEEEYDPESADDFWSAFQKERDDIFSEAEMSPDVFCDAYERLSNE